MVSDGKGAAAGLRAELHARKVLKEDFEYLSPFYNV
jgi:hypothetical protein